MCEGRIAEGAKVLGVWVLTVHFRAGPTVPCGGIVVTLPSLLTAPPRPWLRRPPAPHPTVPGEDEAAEGMEVSS